MEQPYTRRHGPGISWRLPGKTGFSDTEPEIAVVYITILYKEEEIHTRKIELPALYGQQEAEQMEGT